MRSDMICAKSAKCHYLHYSGGYQNNVNISYGGSIDSLFEIKEYIEHL